MGTTFFMALYTFQRKQINVAYCISFVVASDLVLWQVHFQLHNKFLFAKIKEMGKKTKVAKMENAFLSQQSWTCWVAFLFPWDWEATSSNFYRGGLFLGKFTFNRARYVSFFACVREPVLANALVQSRAKVAKVIWAELLISLCYLKGFLAETWAKVHQDHREWHDLVITSA